MVRKSLMFFALALLFVAGSWSKGYAQNMLKIRVLDSASKAPVEFATMSIKYIGETVAKRYALSDSTGVATIKNAPIGRANVLVECVGYRQYHHTFDVHKGANDIGTIYLNGHNQLNTIVVTAAGNQMTVKKDTIEYNANSFKTNETDMLVELLKKLPGVEVGSDGGITANGKTISKIMIDGKTFFMNDPQIATQNLPAKIVEKVKVVQKKSDEAKFTGIDDGDEETVLDLSLKHGMMNGWFGTMGGGYGNDKRYEGTAMVGKFTKQTQISLVASANNTNNRGFFDMAGSMMSAMRNNGGMGGGDGMRGMSFFGSGVTSSKMIGTNNNTETNDKKWMINASNMYSTSNNNVEETKNKTTMMSDTSSLYNNEAGKENTVTSGHNFNSEIEYTPSESTSFVFRPYLKFGDGSFDQSNNFQTIRDSDSTNRGYSLSFGDNESQQIGGSLLYRQRLGKPGRTMTIRLKYDHSHNVVDGYNNSETNYFENNVIDSTYTIDQKYHQVQKENTIAVRASYTEPLGKNYFLQGTYDYSYAKNETEKATYNYNKASHEYSDLDSAYTNDYTGDFISQRAEIDLRKQEDKYNFMFGFSVQPSTTKSTGRGRDTTYNVVNFAPSARLDYRFSDTKFLSIWYQGKTGQPSLSQLLPIADNSNPLIVTEGNDRLNPSFNHDLSIDYRTNNKKNMSWFGLMADASYTKDNIINQKVYTDDGVLHNKYVNSDKGIYDFSARVMFNSRIAKSDFSVSSFFNSDYGNSVSYVSSKGKYVENETKTLNLRENLRLQYRTDNLELMAGGDVSYKNAWYSVSSINDIATWTNSIRGSVNWTFLKNFNISSDIRYTFYRGYSAGYGDAQTIWNSSISKSFLHDAFTFKVAVYDMLDNAKSTYRTTTENYVQDVSNNTLGRYVMFTLTYRFGKFGGQGGMRMGPSGGPGGMRGHGNRGMR